MGKLPAVPLNGKEARKDESSATRVYCFPKLNFGMPKAPTQVLGLAPEVEVRQPPSPYPVRLFWFSGLEQCTSLSQWPQIVLIIDIVALVAVLGVGVAPPVCAFGLLMVFGEEVV